jgi:hypothetical protein
MTGPNLAIGLRRAVSLGLLSVFALAVPGPVRGQQGESLEPDWSPGDEPGLADWARAHLDSVNALPPTDAQEEPARRLERLRAFYFLSVEEGKWSDRARDSVVALREAIPPGSQEEVTLKAYEGALEVVRAKHSRWPPNKLSYLNDGADILDGLVAAHPENLEVRYLRLASYIFLPFFLRRDDSVSDDLNVLVSELPLHPEAFSPPIYRGVVTFLLNHGGLEDEPRERFRQILQEQRRAVGGSGT